MEPSLRHVRVHEVLAQLHGDERLHPLIGEQINMRTSGRADERASRSDRTKKEVVGKARECVGGREQSGGALESLQRIKVFARVVTRQRCHVKKITRTSHSRPSSQPAVI